MTVYLLSDPFGTALLDNYEARKEFYKIKKYAKHFNFRGKSQFRLSSRRLYPDYVGCQTVDIPREYFPMQYAMPVAKGLPYYQALKFHTNVLKVL